MLLDCSCGINGFILYHVYLQAYVCACQHTHVGVAHVFSLDTWMRVAQSRIHFELKAGENLLGQTMELKGQSQPHILSRECLCTYA